MNSFPFFVEKTNTYQLCLLNNPSDQEHVRMGIALRLFPQFFQFTDVPEDIKRRLVVWRQDFDREFH